MNIIFCVGNLSCLWKGEVDKLRKFSVNNFEDRS